MSATSTIVFSSIVTAGSTAAKAEIAGNSPTFKPIIAGFFMGTILLALALVNASIAQSLAVLIAVTAIVLNGTPLFKKIAGMA